MATRADVRRIALSLPGATEGTTGFAFGVEVKGKQKGFAWVWNERVRPKAPKVPNPGVLAIRVANVGQRDAMISAEPDRFFTEPHYNGFPAVLVRLQAVRVRDLRVLLTEGWRCMAPRRASATKTPKATKATGAAKTARPTGTAKTAKTNKATKAVTGSKVRS